MAPQEEEMKRTKIVGLFAVLAMLVAACGGDAGGTTTTAGSTPSTEFGEDPSAADPALIEKALGPVEPSAADSWDIILSAVARANQDLDQATIDKAMECWANQECDTGSGGELVMGYADGGGNDVNVWRAVSHMEAVLQALTYPQIGKIISTAANFDQDPTVHEGQFNFLVQSGVDFIVGYPDIGGLLADEVLAAEGQGIPYIPFSAGYVGLPGTDGALTPGVDYTAVVGEDLCALGESFAEVLTDNVEAGGDVAILGGTPNNALSLGWQRCTIASLGDLNLINPPADENTTTGDTNWFNPIIPDIFAGLLAQSSEIRGYAYEYADGMLAGFSAYETAGIPIENLTLALRTDEQSLFCDWVARDEPTYNIWFSAGGNFQSRISVTAAMLALQGADVPGEIVVPHVMRQVTADDCDENRANPVVSGTSLVPDGVLALMFGSS